MRDVDANCGVESSVLIERAGTAVAWMARSMLGGVYGRRVVVLAGPGNNGADGRVAARILAQWGISVSVVDVDRERPAPSAVDGADLVVDAVLGTGNIREYVAPRVPASTKVLAVDIPSGVDAANGAIAEGSQVLRADVTLTFVAPKPGLLLEPGSSFVGELQIADLGLRDLPLDTIRTHISDESDARRRIPPTNRAAHKWHNAALIVAGSPGMTGAALLSAHAASRAGARMVRLGIPGELHTGDQIVGVALPATNWAGPAAGFAERCGAVLIGPGLGRDNITPHQVRTLLVAPPLRHLPVVVDGDGLAAINADVLHRRGGTTILTPHDGEFTRLLGHAIGSDRIDQVRRFAIATASVVLLKGPTTIVAQPDGHVELVRAGDERLATAGSGDVLAGIITALLCRGMDAGAAAVTAATVHGCAALRGRRSGLVASDLPLLVADVLTDWENEQR